MFSKLKIHDEVRRHDEIRRYFKKGFDIWSAENPLNKGWRRFNFVSADETSLGHLRIHFSYGPLDADMESETDFRIPIEDWKSPKELADFLTNFIIRLV